MKLIYGLAISAVALTLAACGEEVVEEGSDNTAERVDYDPSVIVINEFCYKAETENEFGKKADWIELYNTSSTDVVLYSGEWTISDKEEKPDKYYIPEVMIPGFGYLVLWCDGEDKMAGDIHTNFKLKSEGETISLFNNGVLIDQQSYDSTNADYGCSCRVKDGGDEWIFLNESSPGKEN